MRATHVWRLQMLEEVTRSPELQLQTAVGLGTELRPCGRATSALNLSYLSSPLAFSFHLIWYEPFVAQTFKMMFPIPELQKRFLLLLLYI